MDEKSSIEPAVNYCIVHMERKIDPDSGKDYMHLTMDHRLSGEEHAHYQKCFSDLAFFDEGVGLYYSVQMNMEDLLRSFFEIGSDYLKVGGMTNASMKMSSLSFSRLTLNLMSMFRSFLDHGDAALTRRYGADSAELLAWKAKQSEVYDLSRAYRFMSNLRNYCQHVGVPPLRFSIGSSVEKEGASIGLKFMRDELLSSYSRWQRIVKNDLVTGPEELHLLTYLQDWSVCFQRLASWLLDFRRTAVKQSAVEVLSIRSKYGISENGNIAIAKEPQPGDVLSLQFQHIPVESADDIVNGRPTIDLSDTLELDVG
jgi:hypothetical protein